MTEKQLETRYCLPGDYRPNPVATTRDTEREEAYWNRARLHNATLYQYPVYEYCAQLIADKTITTVIDVGCGVGRKLPLLDQRFSDLRIIGIDQPHPIDYCQQQYNFGEWYADDLENPDPSLEGLRGELLICSDVIEHLADPDRLIEYLKKRCSSDGYMVISTPDRDRLYGPGNRTPGQRDHVREWSGAEFPEYLASRGLQVLEHRFSAPVKVGFNQLTVREYLRQFRRGAKFNYNQICLVRPVKGD